MKTFFNILQTLMKYEKKIYPDVSKFDIYEYSKCDSKYNDIRLLVNNIIHRMSCDLTTNNNTNLIKKTTRIKLQHFNEIINKCFLSNNNKQILQNLLITTQKHYNAFSRLAYIIKFKRSKTVVTDDLNMNPLEISHQSTFTLMQNGVKYMFHINDLINIIETALSNAPNFFVSPLVAKNPYNNEVFSKSTLYNIYFTMKSLPRLISLLFHQYFLCDFDMERFLLNNESTLKDNAITRYVYNSPDITLKPVILIMLKNNLYTRQLTIHDDFPINKLVYIFKPFLYLFLTINYDYSYSDRINYYTNKLFLKLKRFYEFNQFFGRIFYTIYTSNKKLKIRKIEFNTKYLSFHNIKTDCIFNNDNNNEISEYINESDILEEDLEEDTEEDTEEDY